MAVAARQVLNRLNPKTSSLLLCDMQEKFRNTISYFDDVVSTSNRLLNAASILNMSVVATEQYPKGLGKTVPELDVSKLNVPVFEKTCFTMVSDEVLEAMKTKEGVAPKSVIICGIEAHACVYQTAIDLLHREFDVHIVVDAASSRSLVERKYAFKQMERAGAWLTTSECVILSLLGGSKHEKFREIQKLIMTSAPETGLISSRL